MKATIPSSTTSPIQLCMSGPQRSRAGTRVIFAPNATAGSIGLGFAIPSNDVRYLVDALQTLGGLRAGTLK